MLAVLFAGAGGAAQTSAVTLDLRWPTQPASRREGGGTPLQGGGGRSHSSVVPAPLEVLDLHVAIPSSNGTSERIEFELTFVNRGSRVLSVPSTRQCENYKENEGGVSLVIRFQDISGRSLAIGASGCSQGNARVAVQPNQAVTVRGNGTWRWTQSLPGEPFAIKPPQPIRLVAAVTVDTLSGDRLGEGTSRPTSVTPVRR